MIAIYLDDWLAAGLERYGEDRNDWKFRCPSCGHVASVREWRDAGATEGEIAFSCIGRLLPDAKDILPKDGGPCNYAGGGLFRINPIGVIDGGAMHLFDFADDPLAEPCPFDKTLRDAGFTQDPDVPAVNESCPSGTTRQLK